MHIAQKKNRQDVTAGTGLRVLRKNAERPQVQLTVPAAINRHETDRKTACRERAATCILETESLDETAVKRGDVMKPSRAILIPLVAVFLLVLILAGYAAAQPHGGEPENAEKNYRPAVRYEDELYLYISRPPFGAVERESLCYVATLAEDVPSNQLPTENLQSCGCPELVNGDIYRAEEHPEYLFVHNAEEDRMVVFVSESARS